MPDLWATFRLEFAPAAIRELEKLDPGVGRKVLSDIEKLKIDPRPRGVEKLETKEKLYRVYVGPGKNYRAIYQIREGILLVVVVKGSASAYNRRNLNLPGLVRDTVLFERQRPSRGPAVPRGS